jgi:hypothetical protein
MRLSVIGSLAYELLAAGAAVNEMGFDGLTATINAPAFAAAVWVMSMGVIFSLLFAAFAVPYLHRAKRALGGGDDAWMAVLVSAAFFGALGGLAGPHFLGGGLGLAALVGAFVSMGAIRLAVKRWRADWLNEWSLSISIIIGLLTAGLAHYAGLLAELT